MVLEMDTQVGLIVARAWGSCPTQHVPSHGVPMASQLTWEMPQALFSICFPVLLPTHLLPLARRPEQCPSTPSQAPHRVPFLMAKAIRDGGLANLPRAHPNQTQP